MRVLITGDLHGRRHVATKLDALFSSYAPDKIILLGDLFYCGLRNGVPPDYDPLACAQILNRWSSRILSVRGNCDSRADQGMVRFDLTSDSNVVYLNGFRCDLIHGDLLTSELLNVQRGDLLFFGHTHVPMLKKADGVVYLNPGSPSFPKNGHPASYGVMEGLHLEIRRLDGGQTLSSLDLV